MLLLIAIHDDDDSIQIQSLERPRGHPVRPNAEQAVKVPHQICESQGLFYIGLAFLRLSLILFCFLILESAPAPRTMAGQYSAHFAETTVTFRSF
jgi:hypothetical protein